MQSTIKHGPGFAMLEVDLDSGERLVSQPGAMVAMSNDVDLNASVSADPDVGFLTKIWLFLWNMVRSIFGGESVVMNHYRANSEGSVWLAPTMSGDVKRHQLEGEKLRLSHGAYLASTDGVDIDVEFGGLKGLLPWKSTFHLKAKGNGDVWFNAYGGIRAIEVDGSYVVDDGHILAYDDSLDKHRATSGGGLMGLFASGEGLVKEFEGRGTVYIQTRNESALVNFIQSVLPN
ncbi:MAG: TIGR00266 family protein [Bradymonadaceae bacterium]